MGPKGPGWLNPGQGVTYGVTTPLPFIPFMRERMEPTGGAFGNRRVICVSSDAGWRYRFDPVASNDKALVANRDTPEREAARQKLWDVARAAIGRPCAAEATWGGL